MCAGVSRLPSLVWTGSLRSPPSSSYCAPFHPAAFFLSLIKEGRQGREQRGGSFGVVPLGEIYRCQLGICVWWDCVAHVGSVCG